MNHIISTPRRLFQLYRTGGLDEVKRAIFDTIVISPVAPYLVPLLSTLELEVNGHSIVFDIHSTEALFRSQGHGERSVMEDFARNIEETDVVWDVGANHGSYAMLASLCGATTHAFEPGEKARASLREHLKQTPVDITVHPVALGRKKTEMILVEADRSGMFYLTDEGEGELVDVIPGDDVDVCGPDILKIDVEGAEVDVLEGMKSKLSSCRVCYVEIHDETYADVVTFLESQGFQIIGRVEESGHPIIKAVREEI